MASNAPATAQDGPYHVRALERGLLIIELLNRANGMTINDVAAQTGLPRPTAFRFLHTLMELGYVAYAPQERQYRLTAQARGLSKGYKASSWITDIAMPTLDRLAADTPWPITLCVRDDLDIIVAYITDQSSQLIVRRVSSGVIIPPLWSAVGAVFLAHLTADLADRVKQRGMDRLAPGQVFAPEQQQELDQRIVACQADGHSVHEGEGSWALSVPLQVGGVIKAALAIRVVDGGDLTHDDQAHYIASLKDVAQQVEADLSNLQDFSLPFADST